MKLKLYLFLLAFSSHFMSFGQQATHLNFDGVNDYVQVPAGINVANSSFTVEFMAKRTATNVFNYVLTQGGQVDNNLLHIGFRGNNDFTFAFWYNDINIPVANYVADANWHHWSCVYNNVSGTRQVYQDGILVASDSGVAPYTGTGIMQIGSFYGSNNFYNGGIDDLRIWNVAKTAEQINGSKNCELQGTETGLLAYYKFNQGFDVAGNTMITTLTDATANANNGILTNFTLSGATSNWLAGSPVTTGSIVPSNATVTTPVVYNQGATASALTVTTGANGTGLMWYTVATGGTGSTTAPTPSTATAGNTSYWVSSTNANGCESARTEMVVQVNAAATHLNFDGVDDYTSVAAATGLPLGNASRTIEAWVKTNSTTTGTIVNYGNQSANQRFGILSTNSGVYIVGEGNDYSTGFPINDNNWHHVAVTFNGINLIVYVDGVVVGSTTKSYNTTGPLLSLGATYRTSSWGEFCLGNIDNVRIWNVARTADQINGSKNCELQGTETGLVAYYNFNQGFDAAGNTTITTLTDATANANNGTLTNFALSGATSNWLAGSPITTGSIAPSNATVTTPVVYNQGATASALTATTGTNGTGLMWYTVATGGIGSTTAPTPSTASVGNTSYWVSSANVNGCESLRVEVLVNVISSGTTALSQTFCNSATVASLVATGSDLKWYSASAGGSILDPTTFLETGIYYVSQTVNGLESTTRTAVNVTISTIGLIRQHWNDVIFFDNSSNNYVSYKWYKDGMLISGENKQFLKENGGLDGVYFAKATTVSGIEVTSCNLDIVPSAEIRSMKVIPNPSVSGQMTLIRMTLSTTELLGAKLYLFNITGSLINTIDVSGNEMEIQVPYAQGIFPLRLELQNGNVLSTNIAVK